MTGVVNPVCQTVILCWWHLVLILATITAWTHTYLNGSIWHDPMRSLIRPTCTRLYYCEMDATESKSLCSLQSNLRWRHLPPHSHLCCVQQLSGLIGWTIRPVSCWTAFIIIQSNKMAAIAGRRCTTYLITDSVLPVLLNILLAN